MAKNAKLSAQSTPDGEERFLDDGVFPYIFGLVDEEAVPTSLEEIDLAADVVAHSSGNDAAAVGRHSDQCHDMNMWHMAAGTPYGFYLFQALGAQSRLLQSCCLRIATHYPSFQFEVPIYPWFEENSSAWAEMVKGGEEDAAPLQVLVKSLRTWSSLDQAVGVLGGSSTLTLRAVRNPMVLLDRWLGGTQELAVALPQGASPEDPGCPSEAGLPIGGNSVMKGAAKAASFLYLYRLEEAAKEVGTDLDVASLYKSSVFDLRTLALFDEKLVGRRPPSDTRVLTFLAASDLALFTPLHPIFASLRAGMRWSDLHPGYRLRRIFEVIEERGLELASTDAWAYWRFASAICQALKWPEVTRFLDAVRAREKEGPDDNMGRLFRAACAEREVNPTAFIDPFEGMEQLGKLRPPAVAMSEFDSDPDADGALSFAIDAELYALGFQLLFSDEAPKFLCGQYRSVVEQLETIEDMTRTYYGLDL